MYRISPFTYLVDGMLSVGLANTRVVCSQIELSHFNPPSGATCSQYMSPYINALGGYLTNPNATAQCEFCSARDTNVYLAQLSSHYANRWRNFGIMWAFVIFNVVGALFFYWLARVPRKQKVQESLTPDQMSKVQTNVSRPATNVSRVQTAKETKEGLDPRTN